MYPRSRLVVITTNISVNPSFWLRGTSLDSRCSLSTAILQDICIVTRYSQFCVYPLEIDLFSNYSTDIIYEIIILQNITENYHNIYHVLFISQNTRKIRNLFLAYYFLYYLHYFIITCCYFSFIFKAQVTKYKTIVMSFNYIKCNAIY